MTAEVTATPAIASCHRRILVAAAGRRERRLLPVPEPVVLPVGRDACGELVRSADPLKPW